jgi:hypothetical protein
MCAPAALLAISAATTAVSYSQQQKLASANRANAAEQRANQKEEIEAQRAARAGERVKQARAERARLRVAAGEAGIEGVSFEDQMFDIALQEDLDLGMLAKDAEFQQRASDARYRGILNQNAGPSALEMGLGIGTAAYSGYSAGLQIKNQKPSDSGST